MNNPRERHDTDTGFIFHDQISVRKSKRVCNNYFMIAGKLLAKLINGYEIFLVDPVLFFFVISIINDTMRLSKNRHAFEM